MVSLMDNLLLAILICLNFYVFEKEKAKKLRSRICSGNAAGFYSLKTPVASRMIRIKTITSRPDTTQITLSIVFTLTWM